MCGAQSWMWGNEPQVHDPTKLLLLSMSKAGGAESSERSGNQRPELGSDRAGT